MSVAATLLVAVVPLAALLVLWLGYLTSGLRAARQRALRAVRAVQSDHTRLRALPEQQWRGLLNVARTWAADRFQARLQALPIEELKQTGITNVRWSALRSGGFASLADLHGVPAMRLQSLRGVGPATAGRVAAAATELVRMLQAEPVPLPSATLPEPHAAPLVQRATAWIRAQKLDPTPVARAVESVSQQLAIVCGQTGFFAWLGALFGGDNSESIARADALVAEAQALRSAPDFQAVVESMNDIERDAQAPPVPADLIARYQVHQRGYAAVLERAFASSQAADIQVAALVTTPATRSIESPTASPARPPAEPVTMRTGAPLPRGYSIPSPAAAPRRPATITISISSTEADGRPPDDARWHGPGEPAHVAGYTIPGGLLYVGRGLASIAPYRGPDPALVNPDLPIDMEAVDWTGERMPYWPSYSDVGPECRGAYLRWLADGRTHPTVGIGYVFLFFYGLERRLLHDGGRQVLLGSEREDILAEVERLLAIYGAQPSFRRYATKFLAISRVWGGAASLSDGPPPAIEPAPEMPLSVRAALGEIVRAGRPIPADWALAWVRSHPETRWRTPAQRCAVEFEHLFAVRYRERHGDGLVVKPNRTPLTGVYRPASASFGGTVAVPLGDLPDVAALGGPARTLRELAYACVDDLEPYSRMIGRNPAARDTLAAVALLPRELVSTGASAAGERLLDFARTELEKCPHAVVPALALLEQAGVTEGWSRAHALSLAQWLQRAGFGIEPDIRFGARLPKAADHAVLFRLPDGASTPTAAYNGAVALLNMAVMVAQADGAVDADEEARLTTRLQEAMHLDEAERARLAAHLQWLLAAGATLADLKKRVGHIDPGRRDAVAAFLVSVAAADGRLDRNEVDVLGRLYELLGFEREHLYSDLHNLGAPETAATPSRPPDAFTLDRTRIEAKLAESAAVSAILQDIFVSDEAPAPAPVPTVVAAPLVTGLDAVHSAFLQELAVRESWSRAELEASASRLGVLPDGALEVINERAYDLCGEPVVEGDDPLTLNQQVLKELMA